MLHTYKILIFKILVETSIRAHILKTKKYRNLHVYPYKVQMLKYALNIMYLSISGVPLEGNNLIIKIIRLILTSIHVITLTPK